MGLICHISNLSIRCAEGCHEGPTSTSRRVLVAEDSESKWTSVPNTFSCTQRLPAAGFQSSKGACYEWVPSYSAVDCLDGVTSATPAPLNQSLVTNATPTQMARQTIKSRKQAHMQRTTAFLSAEVTTKTWTTVELVTTPGNCCAKLSWPPMTSSPLKGAVSSGRRTG